MLQEAVSDQAMLCRVADGKITRLGSSSPSPGKFRFCNRTFLLGKQRMSTRTGGCLCGQVRYKLSAEPLVSRICWCRDCQRIAGNGTVNAIFPSAALEVSGTTAAYTSTADSGNQITRHFCPQCGAHLFADSSGRPGFSVVRLGTLDDPSSIRPQANIWTASAPAWACLDAALEQFDGQPAPPQVKR